MWLVLIVLHHICKFQPILNSGFFTMASNTMKYSLKNICHFAVLTTNSHNRSHIAKNFVDSDRPFNSVQAFQFRKHYFDLWVGGDGLDMFQQLKGGFGSMQAILPIWGLGAKNGSKTETKKNKIELSFYTIRFVSTKNHPQVKSIQKQKKSTWFNKDNKICHTSDKKLFCEVTHTSIKEIKETSLIRPGRVLFSARENNIFFVHLHQVSLCN